MAKAEFCYRPMRSLGRPAEPQAATTPPAKPRAKPPTPIADIAPCSAIGAAELANACTPATLRAAPKSERLAAAKQLASAVVERGSSAAKHEAETSESEDSASESDDPTKKQPPKHRAHPLNVALRDGLARINLRGSRFAELIGRPAHSVEEWTRGAVRPTPEAMIMLDMIENLPGARAFLEAKHPRKTKPKPSAKASRDHP